MYPSSNVPKTFNIGLITGSQRIPRTGPQITTFIHTILITHLSAPSIPASQPAKFTLTTIDISTLSLPLFNEPGIPSQIHSPEAYAHEHTRAWSRQISSLDGFIFITPQYNWGIPAGLKNAIDYLFNEWRFKPALIVAYGGHGGDKAAQNLKTVLGGGIDMRVVENPICLAFGGRDITVKAATGKDLGLNPADEGALWSDKRGLIIAGWEDFVGLLIEGPPTGAPTRK
ncbi:uncharacterized protein MKZ38_004489 [Zalerion maritima]|uniref:NADPH-dependent FMN reductase-like domain-containing protein n=1 Tax=Zalerion maritima TaxID=339359 RepID=A0AAD5RSF0_9PEZI|nr:uncharacterized protein MKZ38_004489 [Zalerion maritima]